MSYLTHVVVGRTAEQKSHHHDHSHQHEHGHTHEIMEDPGSYIEREPPVYRTDWKKVSTRLRCQVKDLGGRRLQGMTLNKGVHSHNMEILVHIQVSSVPF